MSAPLTQHLQSLAGRASLSQGVYLVGAGGCGMSALGHLMLDLDIPVAGSDLVESDAIRLLRERGAQIAVGHEAARIREFGPALVVYTPAVRRDNPELREAERLNLPLFPRGAVLAALLANRRGLCVAGMHGKTTTSALMAHVLQCLVPGSGHAIGASVPQLGRPARAGRHADSWFVVEADESDATFGRLVPEHAILLNLDEEHLDYYADLAAICQAFGDFAGRVTGKVVYCADDPHLVKLLAGRPGSVSYGFNPLADYRIENVRLGAAAGPSGGGRFEVWRGRRRLGEFTTRLLGAMNLANCTAVVALLDQLEFSADAVARAMAGFNGAERRQQCLHAGAGIQVYEDYGHHPREIRATLQALRSLKPRRVLAVFQPHRYSRTQALLEEFAGCFREADRLWVTEVYAASENPLHGVSGEMVAAAVEHRGTHASFEAEPGGLLKVLQAELRSGDLVVFFGAGDIGVTARELALRLRRQTVQGMKDHFSHIRGLLSEGAILREHEPLAKKTTLRVGGAADLYAEPAGEEELLALIRYCRSSGLPYRLMGRGSNLLIRDGGFRGLIVHLGHEAFRALRVEGLQLRCGAGVRLNQIAAAAWKAGIGGLEFMEGIPGVLGGALRMNAGAMGGTTFDRVETLRLLDPVEGRILELPRQAVPVEYRRCPLLVDRIALGATLVGRREDPAEIEQRMKACSQKRWDSQPAAASAGCMFKNPEEVSAGKLIDQLGLKGSRVGRARVSEMHGNFLVNEGGATAREVLELIDWVRCRVRERTGIELHTEVEIIGEESS